MLRRNVGNENMTNNIADLAKLAEEIPLPEFYHLTTAIFKSGPLAFFGWMGFLIVPLAAVVVILRHFLAPGCHARGTFFFQITHVCFLWFLCYVVVHDHIVSFLCCGSCTGNIMAQIISENLISLGVGICTVIVSCASVALVLRRLPRVSIWSCFGLAAAFASIALIAGCMLMFTL